MKHSNCKDCQIYDEIIDGCMTPCDEDIPDDKHFCIKYKYPAGIPEEIWKGKKVCPYHKKFSTDDNLL